MEVCPTSGIKLNRAGLEVLKCVECGLCSSVCPTESLLWKAPSPLQTIDRVEHIIGVYGEVYIHCSMVLSPRQKLQGVEAPCLGAIPWECWLFFLNNAPKVKIFLPSNHCSSCKIKNGEKVWKQHLHKAKQLSNHEISFVGQAPYMIISNKKVANKVDKSRRRLIGALIGKLTQTPDKIVSMWLEMAKIKLPNRVLKWQKGEKY